MIGITNAARDAHLQCMHHLFLAAYYHRKRLILTYDGEWNDQLSEAVLGELLEATSDMVQRCVDDHSG